MAEKITESIVNLTAEIQNIINSILTDYIKKEDVVDEDLDEENDTDPVTGKSVDEYITAKLTNYVDNDTLATELASLNVNGSIEQALTTYTQNTLTNYVTTTTLYDSIGENLEGHSFKFPKETQTPINKLITAGYYKYTNSDRSTFYCAPDDILYNNALIRVEKQNDYIIQHVYSTLLDSNNVYQIDGREFVRHGYLTSNNNETVTNWEDWKVSYLPWRKRDDLLDGNNSGPDKGKGENVDDDSFHIYECTAGYVFQWTQKSSDKRFVLPQNQYTYAKVHTFKELPIPEPTIFSNYIGHMDLKISKKQVEIRSSSNKGEYIVGVDGNYFVPRTN